MTPDSPKPVFNQFFAYWGKARPGVGQDDFHLLVYHCLDVAAVGAMYLERRTDLTDWLVAQSGFPDRRTLIDWMCFWLALHDLGKFSRSFQCQRVDLFEQLRSGSPTHTGLSSVRHDSLGQWLIADVLVDRIRASGWFGDGEDWIDVALIWARAATGHHGQPPLGEATQNRALKQHFPEEERAAAWQFAQEMGARFLTDGVRRHVATLQQEASVRRCRALSWWVAGIAVLADWIGSDARAFCYRSQADLSLDAYWRAACAVADRALRQTGVLPTALVQVTNFGALFPAISAPSPLQHWASTVPLSRQAQLHLLEDVTGAGKTEAAVMLAQRLMATGVADGFFIGLPTMATANAMYSRIAQVYARLFDGVASLALAHGRKDLVEDFAASVLPAAWEEGDPCQMDDSASSRCARWLADHNKRALLAPAGVGTIDQALLAVLQAKHQSLRLLGLFRKVLVVDEVHACDAYMQRTLETLLEFHAATGGSAILLSATLPQRMKNALLKSFARGAGHTAPRLVADTYPLVSSWPGQAGAKLADECPTATRPDVHRTVRVRYASDLESVLAAIRDALSKGRCVGWIRNTVSDVLQARDLLSPHVSADLLTVFHARFTLGDRLHTENEVLAALGSSSTPASRRGRLLIASQVAEQSLDIDADIIFSDLAPIDRLIQRAGRLARHARTADGLRLPQGQPDQRGEPCFWVYGPAWMEAPSADWYKQLLPRAAHVYDDHAQLWLTAKALQAGAFTMPGDARALIEGVFGDEAEVPSGLQSSNIKAEGKAHGARSLAQLNSVTLSLGYRRDGVDWLSDSSAPSRQGEESVDVVLARWHDGQLQPWCCDRTHHAWAYSTVRMARRQIDQEAPLVDPMHQSAVAAAKAGMPGGGKWVLLLVLFLEGNRWVGEALAPARDAQSPVRRRWVYDAQAGLLAEKAPEGA
jgi:CRISPR-associated endonuclease/helicase Cas3